RPGGGGVRGEGLRHAGHADGPVPGDNGGGRAHHHVGAQIARRTGLPCARARGHPARAVTEAVTEAGAAETEEPDPRAFTVHLTNFSGPFDLLLSLIDSRRLGVTEVALHAVTDEVIAHTRLLGREAGREEGTEFLVVASTVLVPETDRMVPPGAGPQQG